MFLTKKNRFTTLTTLGALRARATIVHSLEKDLFFAIIFR